MELTIQRLLPQNIFVFLEANMLKRWDCQGLSSKMCNFDFLIYRWRSYRYIFLYTKIFLLPGRDSLFLRITRECNITS